MTFAVFQDFPGPVGTVYIMLRVFFIVECGIRALSLCYACIRSLGIILIP